MKMEIKKYPIQDEIRIPKGADVLEVLIENDIPTLSALVNPKKDKETRFS